MSNQYDQCKSLIEDIAKICDYNNYLLSSQRDSIANMRSIIDKARKNLNSNEDIHLECAYCKEKIDPKDQGYVTVTKNGVTHTYCHNCRSAAVDFIMNYWEIVEITTPNPEYKDVPLFHDRRNYLTSDEFNIITKSPNIKCPENVEYN